jgi:hypothetical protein
VLKSIILMIFLVLLVGCASTDKTPLSADSFNMTSTDPSYGFTEKDPIELGGFLRGTKYEGAHVEYFNSLQGPNGEQVQVKRLGSCCSFEDASMPFGGGLLDMYELTYNGISQPMVIYVNLYKFVKPMAPIGFALQ